MAYIKKTRENIDRDFDALVSAMHSSEWQTSGMMAPEQRILRTMQSQGILLLTPGEVCSMRASTDTDPSKTLRDEFRRGAVLGIHIKSEWRYPDFQFDQNGIVKPSTRAFLKYILESGGHEHGGWSVVSWLVRGNAALDYFSPYKFLDTRPDDVHQASRIFFSRDE